MFSLRFLKSHWRELAFGFLMCFLSSFGQTFFISLFGGHIRAEFAISDGEWGSIYSAGTIASALVLVWSGRLVDRLRLADMAALVIAGLAIMCLAAGLISTPFLLIAVIFGLRQFGQGLSGHTGITAMVRRFTAERGRAVSIASLGYTAGEALLPLTVVAALVIAPWRSLWLICAVFLVALIPLVRWLVAEKHTSTSKPDPTVGERVATGEDHQLAEVLRDPSLWFRLPALLAPSFIFTGLILHQIALAEAKGWPLTLWASSYLAFAVCSFVSIILSGMLVDRVSARRLVPVFLAPLALGCVALWYGMAPVTAFVFMSLIGLGAGLTQIISSSVWSELYGVAHIGSIRAFGTAVMVLSSGLAPAIMGLSMDAGVTMETIALTSAVYCLFASLLATMAPAPAKELTG